MTEEIVIGILIVILLLAVLAAAGSTRARITELRNEFQTKSESLRAEIAQVRSDTRRDLTLSKAETREEREQRENAESQRRDEMRRRELERVAGECAAVASEFAHVGEACQVIVKAPTREIEGQALTFTFTWQEPRVKSQV